MSFDIIRALMCGIVAYIGSKETTPLLLKGLKRLEYRGYDSAGIALATPEGKILLAKKPGKIKELEATLPDGFEGVAGIAHTRWATHGEPNELNAHPHLDCKDNICVVHNGIIENFAKLKDWLTGRGHTFRSDTDTEVLAHLIEEALGEGTLAEAVRRALKYVEGTFGIAVIAASRPGVLIAARRGSPLVVGDGDGEKIIASDASAIVDHTRNVIYLEDNELAEVKKDKVRVYDMDKVERSRPAQRIDWNIESIEKAGYAHFLIKEIMEQPESLSNAIRGRLEEGDGDAHFGGLNTPDTLLRKIDSVIFTSMGTAFNAALIGEYMLENIAGIPAEAENAAEFRYKNPIVRKNTLGIAISQSGETADTLAAARELKKRGAKTLGIVNVVGSTVAREVDGGVYIHAGPEISVASTKAFTSQLIVLAMLTLHFARLKGMSKAKGKEIVKEIRALPVKVQKILDQSEKIRSVASAYSLFNNFLFLGRNYQYPVALEGALKLKEISYIHAEGYSAAEMKHGPIALIDENFASVFIAPKDALYEKTLSNMEEVKARKGPVLAIATEGDKRIEKIADDVLYVPKAPDWLLPILTSIPLQLLAYYIAIERGTDVDQPRNLAKSVTVE